MIFSISTKNSRNPNLHLDHFRENPPQGSVVPNVHCIKKSPSIPQTLEGGNFREPHPETPTVEECPQSPSRTSPQKYIRTGPQTLPQKRVNHSLKHLEAPEVHRATLYVRTGPYGFIRISLGIVKKLKVFLLTSGCTDVRTVLGQGMVHPLSRSLHRSTSQRQYSSCGNLFFFCLFSTLKGLFGVFWGDKGKGMIGF